MYSLLREGSRAQGEGLRGAGLRVRGCAEPGRNGAVRDGDKNRSGFVCPVLAVEPRWTEETIEEEEVNHASKKPC